MATDATPPPARFIVTDPVSAPPARAWRVPRAPLDPHRRWRDPSGPDMFRSSLAAGASAAALTVMVLTSLLLVSLAAARPGILLPARVLNTDFFPSWMSGPTGVLTGWFTADAHAERVLF